MRLHVVISNMHICVAMEMALDNTHKMFRCDYTLVGSLKR